jgi:glycosyltransferase involved in cell wall biosynthesis
MAYGLPVVCSNFGTINSFVSETGSGIPVDPLDPSSIAEAIASILTQKELYKKLSDHGAEAVKQKYNWGSEEKKLLDIYSDLMGKTTPPHHESAGKPGHG